MCDLLPLARGRGPRRNFSASAAAAIGHNVVSRKYAGLEQIAGDTRANQRSHDEQPHLRKPLRVRRGADDRRPERAPIATMVRPKAAAMPRISIDVAPLPIPPMTAAPQPISTSANVPMNSAIAFFMFMAIFPLAKPA